MLLTPGMHNLNSHMLGTMKILGCLVKRKGVVDCLDLRGHEGLTLLIAIYPGQTGM